MSGLSTLFSAFLGAGVINPLNLRLAGKELQFILADSATKVIFVDSLFAEHLARKHPRGAGTGLRGSRPCPWP